MGYVSNRIFDLTFVQWPARPVGKPRALVEGDPEPAVDQIGIADLFALPDRHGGNLRVEYRVRCFAGQIVDDLDILAASMKYLEHLFIVDEQVEQRLKVDAFGKGVNSCGFFAIRNLDQA